MPSSPLLRKQRVAPTKPAEPSVTLSQRGVLRLQGRHPWVYRSDIFVGKDASKNAASPGVNDVPPGAVVRVLDQRGKFLGTALYSSSSQIAIRTVSWRIAISSGTSW